MDPVDPDPDPDSDPQHSYANLFVFLILKTKVQTLVADSICCTKIYLHKKKTTFNMNMKHTVKVSVQCSYIHSKLQRFLNLRHWSMGGGT